MRTRPLRCLTTACAVLAATIVPAVALVASPAAAATTLIATPSTDVLAGPSSIQIDGSGFSPGASVGYCLGVPPTGTPPASVGSTDVRDVPFCGTSLDYDQVFPVTEASSEGAISASLRAERYIFVYEQTRLVDCADPLEHCTIHAFARNDVRGTLVSAPLDFAPPPAPPASRGAITVSPSTGLRVGDHLQVTGSGFRPDATIDLYRCETDPASRGRCERLRLASGAGATLVTDDVGAFATGAFLELSQSLILYPYAVPPDPIYCDAGPGACVIAAAEAVDFAGTVATAPISYVAATPPKVVPGVGSLAEGNSGTTTVEVPVTLSNRFAQTVTVQWNSIYVPGASGNQADPASDYVPVSGTVTFAPGEISKTVSVNVNGDTLVEPDEYIVVSFHDPTNAVMGGFWGLGFGVIVNDD